MASPAIERYRTVPLPGERLRYLEACAETGVRPYTLRTIAGTQVHLVHLLDLQAGRGIRHGLHTAARSPRAARSRSSGAGLPAKRIMLRSAGTSAPGTGPGTHAPGTSPGRSPASASATVRHHIPRATAGKRRWVSRPTGIFRTGRTRSFRSRGRVTGRSL